MKLTIWYIFTILKSVFFFYLLFQCTFVDILTQLCLCVKPKKIKSNYYYCQFLLICNFCHFEFCTFSQSFYFFTNFCSIFDFLIHQKLLSYRFFISNCKFSPWIEVILIHRSTKKKVGIISERKNINWNLFIL